MIFVDGGAAAGIQHGALRITLWSSGAMSLAYTRFLAQDVRYIILQRVGGGYIFVHRLLAEYFATLDTIRPGVGLPTYAWALAERSKMLLAIDQYDEALEDFNQALMLNAKDTLALANRGETYRLLGRHEEALADFTRSLALDRRNAWVYGSHGQSYAALERYEEAVADFIRAIKLDNDDLNAYASRGETYRRMGRYEAALADLDHTLPREPSLDTAYAIRGHTYAALGRQADALAEALAQGATASSIAEALANIEDFLTSCPDHASAQETRLLLRASSTLGVEYVRHHALAVALPWLAVLLRSRGQNRG